MPQMNHGSQVLSLGRVGGNGLGREATNRSLPASLSTPTKSLGPGGLLRRTNCIEEQRTRIRALSKPKQASETILGSQGAFQKGFSDATGARRWRPVALASENL